MKHLSRYIKISCLKNRNRYGIYITKVYIDKKYIKLKEIEFSNRIKFKYKKFLPN